MALESTNDWLQVVFDHRKAPKNEKSPGTLQCLEGLGLDVVKGFQAGPGVGAMLTVFSSPAELKSMRSGQRWGRGAPGRRLAQTDSNPMGDTVQREARYEETMPPGVLEAQQDCTMALDDALPEDDGGAAFFFTELDEAAPAQSPQPPRPYRAAAPEATLSPSTLATRGLSASPAPLGQRASMTRSSSVPALPRLGTAASGSSSTSVEPPQASTSAGGLVRAPPPPDWDRPPRLVSQSRKGGGCTRDAAVTKAFNRCIVGKSVLALTDRAESRRGVMRALQSSITEFELLFVKSSTDLWTRLNNAKEHYHALILDLSKNELQVDAFLKTVRQHGRYGRMPIIVLAQDRDLTDSVRTNCSFVVFQPISASMLREGLLWCFDRKAMQKHDRQTSPDRGAQQALKDSSSAPSLALTVSPAQAMPPTPQLVAAAA